MKTIINRFSIALLFVFALAVVSVDVANAQACPGCGAPAECLHCHSDTRLSHGSCVGCGGGSGGDIPIIIIPRSSGHSEGSKKSAKYSAYAANSREGKRALAENPDAVETTGLSLKINNRRLPSNHEASVAEVRRKLKTGEFQADCFKVQKKRLSKT